MRGVLVMALVASACGPQDDLAPRWPLPVSRRDEIRPTDTSITSQMWRFDATETVERRDSPDGGFRVHFTRSGRNAVPAADTNANGTPDFVEAVAEVYDEVGGLYAGGWGFRRPLGDAALASNGGDGRYDVYLLDFAGAADGAMRVDACTTVNTDQCITYVTQENDFVGYGYPSVREATRILGSHEYFHGVQAAYDHGQDVVLSEGTAVWATERYDPSSRDFEGFIGGYLSRPERSLDSPPPGPVPTFAYGSAIFFRFLSERFGADVIRQLWERVEKGAGDPSEPANQANPTWVVQLDALLKRSYASSFSEAFLEFARWNLYTGAAADARVAYAEGASYPEVAMTATSAPIEVTGLRVFYASAQYFRLPAGARTEMTARLVDDPLFPDDDTAGLQVLLIARRGGVNEAQAVAPASVATPAGSEVLVGIVNTARAPVGTALSKRPSLCVGSPAEVEACVAHLQGAATDGGVDGGSVDAGVGPAMLPPGCGCGSSPTSALLGCVLALVVGRNRSRRREA